MRFNLFRRRPVTTTAESFCGADGVTINGGVHSVVSGVKMTIGGDVDMKDVERAREAALQDGSTNKEASLFAGAKHIFLDGANTESIGGGSITITGTQRNPLAVDVELNRNSPGSAVKSGASTRPPKITATVGRGARNVIIRPQAVVSANAGGRVVGRNIDDVLKVLDKMGYLEQKGGDRDADALPDAFESEVVGVVRAIGGYEVILDQGLDNECLTSRQ